MGGHYRQVKLPEAVEELIRDTKAVVRIGYPWWLRPFLARDVIGITLGRRIYLNPKVSSRPNSYMERLLRHELAHVRQVNRHGLIGFLVRYVTEFLRHFVREKSVAAAYRKISFEVEAAAAEESL
jgi:Domain of unknown function (DUF4157)